MNEIAIIDSGPLVALLVQEDAYHDWVVERFREMRSPLLTCEAVLTETFYLVRKLKEGHRRFFDLLDSSVLEVKFSLIDERKLLERLIQKYAQLPMSLADACLVRMAELNHNAVIFTVDHHFEIYRKHGRQVIPLVLPP